MKTYAVNLKNLNIAKGEGLEQLDKLEDDGRTVLNLTFLGYEHDPRELYEVPEVREWVIEFLIHHTACLRFLSPQSFMLVEACANIVRKKGERSSPVEVEITQGWFTVCQEQGIDALGDSEKGALERVTRIEKSVREVYEKARRGEK